jgi:hypothetical protein
MSSSERGKTRALLDVIEKGDAAAGPSSSSRPRRACRKAYQEEDDKKVIIIEHDEEANEVKVLPSSLKKKKLSSTAAAATATARQGDDYDEEDDVALLEPSACAACGSEEQVLRLGHCHHTLCLPCLRKVVGDDKEKYVSQSLRCPVADCTSSLLAAGEVLHVLAPRDYDIYASQEIERFVSRLQEGKTTTKCSTCQSDKHVHESVSKADVQQQMVLKGKKKRMHEEEAESESDDQAAKATFCECQDCERVFCTLCFTSLSLGREGKMVDKWKRKHGSACPARALVRVWELQEGTRVALDNRQGKSTLKKMLGKASAAAAAAASTITSVAGTSEVWAKGRGKQFTLNASNLFGR